MRKLFTRGHLNPETPYAHIFPDGHVPLTSIWPMVPREIGAPTCYLLDVSELTDEQIADLALMVYERWKPEVASVEDAVAYILNPGLPLETKWFSGAATNRLALLIP